MKHTVYIPDELAKGLSDYLLEHPSESPSSIMQEAIRIKLAEKNVADFLALAGIVEDGSCHARDRTEDAIVIEARP